GDVAHQLVALPAQIRGITQLRRRQNLRLHAGGCGQHDAGDERAETRLTCRHEWSFYVFEFVLERIEVPVVSSAEFVPRVGVGLSAKMLERVRRRDAAEP